MTKIINGAEITGCRGCLHHMDVDGDLFCGHEKNMMEFLNDGYSLQVDIPASCPLENKK